MIPFPGESLGVWAASDVGGIGEDLSDLVTNRAGSATLAAGGEWVAWIRVGWPRYLEDGTTPVDVSWVVEVLSGSVTVAVSEAHQAGIDETDPTGTALGTTTLTTGTNVITSTFDAADTLTGGGYLMVRLVASSGSAVVQQVKMRVWPPEGVAGGWSTPYPAWTLTPGANINAASDTRHLGETATSPPGPVLPLWETVKAAIQAQAGDTYTSTLSGAGSVVGGQVTTETYAFEGDVLDSEATWTLSLPYVHATRPTGLVPQIDPDLTAVDGVDYIRPPDEVRFDEPALIDPLGTVAVSWDETTATVQTIHDEDGGGQIYVAAIPYTPGVDPMTVTFAWPDDAVAQDGDTLALPNSDELIFAATHSLMREDVPLALGSVPDEWRFVVGNGAYAFDGVEAAFVGLRYVAQYPQYRLWLPTITRKIPLRQFHRDDGLGVTPPRAYGGSSRTRTGRAYGYT